VTILTQEHALPVQQACKIARYSRTALYRAQAAAVATAADVDAPIIAALQAVIAHTRWDSGSASIAGVGPSVELQARLSCTARCA
jgi:hypothetical protein